MDYFVHALREHPELALFLTLALGFAIGKIKIGSFGLGTIVGTLLAGVVVGQMRAIPEQADSELPALGYTVPYAIGNIVLTARGPVLVAMMS